MSNGNVVDKKQSDLQEKLICVNRVSKTVKGGRIFSFAALVVSGDGKGRVGFGYGKAREALSAIQKASEFSKRNLESFDLRKSTIQHRLEGAHDGSRIFMKPARPGTGVIAGGAMRAICEAGGIKDVLAKVYGSSNPLNVVRATLAALRKMQTPFKVARKRGKSVAQVFKGS